MDFKKKDNLFAGNIKEIVDFRFDEKVANVFEDMLRRSIPGYSTIIAVTGMFAAKYARASTNIYDLGCSLGASAMAMQQTVKLDGCKIKAIDNSEAMIKRASEFIDNSAYNVPIELVLQDVRQTHITNASVVAMNLTLQFIPPSERADVINKIYRGLNKGGILILTEKVKFSDENLNALQTDHYYEFKKMMGYSDMEISRKRDALEKVMILDTEDEHIERLKKAGFYKCEKWFQIFNFISFIAVK